jgi:hypothetical protein
VTGNNQDRQPINIPWRYEVIHFETVSKALDREASKSHLSLFEALFVGSIRTVVSLSLFWLRLVNLPRYVKIGRRLFTSCCLMINGLSCSGWCRHWGVCSYKHVDDLLYFSMIFFANRRFPVSNWSLAIHWKGVAHRRQSLRFTHYFGCLKQSDRTGCAFSNCNRNQKELLELCKTNENDKDDEKELHREITFAEQEDIAV